MHAQSNTLSVLFTSYNLARRINGVDRGRLNRALGVAQRCEPRPYDTTTLYCSCPDFSGVAPDGRRFRQQSLRPCKHIIAAALLTTAAPAVPFEDLS